MHWPTAPYSPTPTPQDNEMKLYPALPHGSDDTVLMPVNTKTMAMLMANGASLAQMRDVTEESRPETRAQQGSPDQAQEPAHPEGGKQIEGKPNFGSKP